MSQPHAPSCAKSSYFMADVPQIGGAGRATMTQCASNVDTCHHSHVSSAAPMPYAESILQGSTNHSRGFSSNRVVGTGTLQFANGQNFGTVDQSLPGMGIATGSTSAVHAAALLASLAHRVTPAAPRFTAMMPQVYPLCETCSQITLLW